MCCLRLLDGIKFWGKHFGSEKWLYKKNAISDDTWYCACVMDIPTQFHIHIDIVANQHQIYRNGNSIGSCTVVKEAKIRGGIVANKETYIYQPGCNSYLSKVI